MRLSRSVLAILCALATARPAFGDEPGPRVHWDESHPRFRTWEYVATSAALVGFLAVNTLTPTPTNSSWRGNAFDDAGHDFFHGRTRAVRDRANDLSDYFTYAPQAYSVVVDPLLTFTVIDGTVDAAWQMTAMNFEVYGTVGLLVRAGERGIPRLRPATVACQSDPEYETACRAGPAASFPSGHSALAFAGAGLTCAHHLHLGLYGGWGDGVACGGAIAVATTSAALRLVADRHWLSDVLIGTAVGFGGGYLMPTLLHYAPTITTGSGPDIATIAIAPMPSLDAFGAAAIGVF